MSAMRVPFRRVDVPFNTPCSRPVGGAVLLGRARAACIGWLTARRTEPRAEEIVNSQRIRFVFMMLAGLALAGPAFAQTPSTPAAPEQKVPTPPDADESFLTGLRRVGVLAGQAIQCSPDADKQAQISDAMALADQVALHFGLRAAFSFVGATGYGSGHPFDKSVCPQALDGWKGLVAKYLNK